MFFAICDVLICLTFLLFFTLYRKPRRVFKSFLGAVARYTQILSPWRAMATPLVSKVIEKSCFSDPGVPGTPPGGPRGTAAPVTELFKQH